MYETSIAHALGKRVVPMSQSLDNVSFDMRHHRVLKYLANKEELSKLIPDLAAKLRQVSVGTPASPAPEAEEDDLPF